ncbi:MAG: hypothetical protein OCU20_04820 [Methanophagales archaeon]|nr:hypothetical protein [Methanophagales archaeon]
MEIKGFDNGIWFEGTGSSKFTNITVENCLIHDNGAGTRQGIHLLHVCNSTIKNKEQRGLQPDRNWQRLWSRR